MTDALKKAAVTGGLGVTESQTPKKRAAVSGGFEVDNREASNRVDRSHSVSKLGRYKSYSGKLNRS
jgi:hypothetical protein